VGGEFCFVGEAGLVFPEAQVVELGEVLVLGVVVKGEAALLGQGLEGEADAGGGDEVFFFIVIGEIDVVVEFFAGIEAGGEVEFPGGGRGKCSQCNQNYD